MGIQGGNVGEERHDNWGTVRQSEGKWAGDRVDNLKMYKNLYKSKSVISECHCIVKIIFLCNNLAIME